MKQRDHIWTIFWHVLFVLFFVSIPYFTTTAQRIEGGKNTQFPVAHPESIWNTAVYLRWCVQNIILSGLFYITYLVLAPKFLSNKRKYHYFILWSLISLLVFIVIIHFEHKLVDFHIGRDSMRFKFRFINTFLYTFAVLILATALHLYNEYRALHKNQVESELLFLRSQINPHFLFNSLNNIYSLIVLRSDKAAGAMLKLSDMLRFVLYEAGEKYVLLKHELKYLDDYISLQRLRLNENVKLDYLLTGKCTIEKIHPMLLVPFIENAFKHGVSYSEPCGIDILLQVENGVLKLKVSNGIFKNKTDELKKESGIGMVNVKRRLQILYAGKYQLVEHNNGLRYEIILTLDLNEN